MTIFEATTTTPSASVSPAARARAQLAGIVRLLRPHQWVKNVAVLLVPAMTVSVQMTDIGRSLAAAAAFCLTSSGVYILNDYLDIDRDRRHPTKQHRPLPSGAVSQTAAVATLVFLGVLAAAVGSRAGPAVLAVLGLYGAINVAYCCWAKHIAVLDIVCVSSGFVLRVIAGAFAVNVVANPGLLGAVAAGSFALVVAKRRSELCRHAGDIAQRPALAGYTLASLDQVLLGSCVAAALLYFTSAATSVQGQIGSSLLALTMLMALAGALRLLHIVQDDRNSDGEDPALLLMGDTVLRTIVLLSISLAATTTMLSHAAGNA